MYSDKRFKFVSYVSKLKSDYLVNTQMLEDFSNYWQNNERIYSLIDSKIILSWSHTVYNEQQLKNAVDINTIDVVDCWSDLMF